MDDGEFLMADFEAGATCPLELQLSLHLNHPWRDISSATCAKDAGRGLRQIKDLSKA